MRPLSHVRPQFLLYTVNKPITNMNLTRWLSLTVSVAVFATALFELPSQVVAHLQPTTPAPAPSTEQATNPPRQDGPSYLTTFLSDGGTRLVHAPSLAQTGNDIVAVWFGGSREGATDVNLYADRKTLTAASWGNDWVAMTPERIQRTQHRYIKKLGNAVLAPRDDGALSMFFVSVSLGGWATSSVNHAISTDGGLTFGDPLRLVTSPLFNLSTLVKGTPRRFSDNSIALPVYHELAGKFGELLHLGPNGRVRDKARITARRHSLQPVVFVDSDRQATALLRYCGETAPRRVILASSNDGGKNWSDLGKTALPNPNAALTGLRLDTGEYLLVLNDQENDRNRLGLFATGDNGKSFKVLHYFEDMSLQQPYTTMKDFQLLLRASLEGQGMPEAAIGPAIGKATETMCSKVKGTCTFQFDYPYLIESSDGNFHLAYTWNKSFIKYVSFNRAWLESLL